MGVRATNQSPASRAILLATALTRLRSRLRVEARLTATGFSLTQLAMLRRLLEEGPMTAAGLASVEHVSHQAVGQGLAPFREADLVRAEPDPTDGRKVLMAVTPAGADLIASLDHSREVWLVRAISAVISDDELPALDHAIELLERLAAADLNSKLEIR